MTSLHRVLRLAAITSVGLVLVEGCRFVSILIKTQKTIENGERTFDRRRFQQTYKPAIGN